MARRGILVVSVVLAAVMAGAAAGAQVPPAPGQQGQAPPAQGGAQGQSPPAQGGGQGQAPPTSGPQGQSPPRRPSEDPPDVQDAARTGVVIVAEEAAVLAEIDAFPEPLPEDLELVLEVVRAEDRWDEGAPRDVLLAEIDDLQAEAVDERVLARLVAGDVPIDPAVATVLGGFDDDQLAALEADQTALLDPQMYLDALDALATRNGRPGLDPNTPPLDGAVLAASLEVAYDELDGQAPSPDDEGEVGGGTGTDGDAAEGTTVDDVAGTLADEPADDADGGVPAWVWGLVAAAVVAAALAVVAVVRGRGGDARGERFDDLLDVSRRLAAARNAAEVERIAAAEAVRLVDGSSAAIVHRRDGTLGVGHETDPGLLVPERLGDGLLRRVVDTGQPVAAMVRDEPALRQLPVALVAVPVIGDGSVNAVVSVVRSPDRPFGTQEIDVLRSLGPVLAAALDSARHAEDAASASLTDPLTGVANRRRLETDLPAVLAAAQGRTAVVMVDLDHFKAVNDRYGHPGGDMVLRQAAAALVEAVRPGDRVYRYGGEEFAVVLPSTNEAEGVAAAERLRAAVAAAHFEPGDGVEHRNTVSLGVASTEGPEDVDAHGLIARSDRALYRAKEGGRDRVVGASELAG